LSYSILVRNILVFKEIAQASESFRPKAINAILLACCSYSKIPSLGLNQLNILAHELNVTSSTDLLAILFMPIISCWIAQKPLVEFPSLLLGCDDKRTFYVQWESDIVVICLINQQLDTVHHVAADTNNTIQGLVEKNFSQLMANILANQVKVKKMDIQNISISKICDQWLSGIIGK